MSSSFSSPSSPFHDYLLSSFFFLLLRLLLASSFSCLSCFPCPPAGCGRVGQEVLPQPALHRRRALLRGHRDSCHPLLHGRGRDQLGRFSPEGGRDSHTGTVRCRRSHRRSSWEEQAGRKRVKVSQGRGRGRGEKAALCMGGSEGGEESALVVA
eukprot:753953-Hanusia_phi.AAC.12